MNFVATAPAVTTYTVTFDSAGGSAVTAQTIEAGQKATKPADPTKAGYDFKGWTLNGSAYDFNTAVNGDITLVATWEQQQVVPTVYTVTFDSNGGSAVTAQTIEAGQRATKPADPTKSGYVFKGWTLNGAAYNFNTAVSSDMTLYAAWEAKAPMTNPFVDVKKSDYFYAPVLWAVEKEITNGMDATHFAPNNSCTRGQVVTFLWRAAGKPKVSGSNPFKDVKKTDYFYDAVLWAVKNGITNGMDATHFAPDATCTRGQIVTFLYRAAGKPKVSGSNPFKDVKKTDYFYDAVLWAVKNEITNGMDATHFGPASTCTRGQVVTFLYRKEK